MDQPHTAMMGVAFEAGLPTSINLSYHVICTSKVKSRRPECEVEARVLMMSIPKVM